MPDAAPRRPAADGMSGANRQSLRLGRNRRQGQNLEFLLLQQMTGQVVLVEPLHRGDDGAGLLVVEAAIERLVVKFVDPPALGFGFRLGRLDRIVDDQGVAAPPGQRAADRCGQAKAVTGGGELGLGVFARIDAGGGEDPPVPIGFEDDPSVAGVLAGKLVRVGDHDDAARRVMPENVSGEGDRDDDRLQRSGRQVDDQAQALARYRRFEMPGEAVDMPGVQIPLTRTKGLEHLGDKAGKIAAQHRIEQRQVIDHWSSCPAFSESAR